MSREFSNMPISEVVYGEDHPRHRPPHTPWECTYPGTAIAKMLPLEIRKALYKMKDQLLKKEKKHGHTKA